jgi:hypothetical protein
MYPCTASAYKDTTMITATAKAKATAKRQARKQAEAISKRKQAEAEAQQRNAAQAARIATARKATAKAAQAEAAIAEALRNREYWQQQARSKQQTANRAATFTELYRSNNPLAAIDYLRQFEAQDRKDFLALVEPVIVITALKLAKANETRSIRQAQMIEFKQREREFTNFPHSATRRVYRTLHAYAAQAEVEAEYKSWAATVAAREAKKAKLRERKQAKREQMAMEQACAMI